MATSKKNTKPINAQQTEQEFVGKVYSLFEEFRSAYAAEWERLTRNDRLYLGRHWDDAGELQTNNSDPKPVTPVIHSTVENLKADLMDYFPKAIIQPENPSDKEIAEVVGALIAQNHDAINYRNEYVKACHDLLVGGYCVQEVGYDTAANKNIGSAFIRYIDQHNILFDPQCVNIQEGRAVFKIAPKTIESLEQRYPDKKGAFATDEYQLDMDSNVNYDASKSVLCIEYWWREYDTSAALWRVHMALVAGRQLLEDSRRAKPDGYIGTGEYPFVVTSLYRRKNSPLGYGVPDMYGDGQKYADKLDQIVLKNARMASHNKMLVTHSSGFDVDDLRDWAKDVHQGDSLTGVTWFTNPPLPQYLLQLPSLMRNGIKDDSGANDFSRGNTSSGVTAASAIAALQEAASKRSRMIVGLMHEAFRDAVRYEIEFEREFNILPREVLVTVDGEQHPAAFESALLTRHTELGNDVPIEFLVSIKVERDNKWSTVAHNELILQMVQLQVLNPQQALELMVFEGKEQILHRAKVQQPSPEQMMEQMEAEQASAEQAAMENAMSQLPPPEQMGTQSQEIVTA